MKLKDAIICDVRKEGVWDELIELLYKIPPLKKYEGKKVPLEKLESLMLIFYEKYGVKLQYIMFSPQKTKAGENESYYSCSLKGKDDHTWLGTVYGKTIYECYVKMVLLSYGYVKKQKK